MAIRGLGSQSANRHNADCGGARLGAGKHCDFKGAEGPAGVAVGNVGEEFECVVVYGSGVLTEAARFVGKRAVDDCFDFVDRERLELENAAAANECVVDGEKRIRGGDANEDDDTFFDVGQQSVLLCSIKAMDLINHKKRWSPAGGDFVARLL